MTNVRRQHQKKEHLKTVIRMVDVESGERIDSD
jgi:hypothetical protein